MKVAEQMDQSPLTARPDTLVTDLARAMVGRGLDHVVILDGAGSVVGMVTAADLIAKHARLHFPTYFSLLGFSFPVGSHKDESEIQQALAATAGDLMSTNLVSVTADTDVDDAATLMLDHEVSCLPVLDGDKLLGTIDEMDIVRLLVVEDAG